jgi:acyl-coenzyme A synthetase/AMP-(fatty) acid ligase
MTAVDRPRSICHLLDTIARRHPARVLLAEPSDETVRAGTLRDEVAATAGALTALGVEADERVVLDCHDLSLHEFTRMYFALVWAGAVPVLAPEPGFAAADSVGPTHRIARDTATGSADIPLEKVLSAVEPQRPPRLAGQGILDIVFTSGTTGAWKPSVSTHAQWLAALPVDRPHTQAAVVAQGGVPWAASAGVHGIVLHHLSRAATSLWANTPHALADLAARKRATELHLTPHALRALIAESGHLDPEWVPIVRTIKTVGGSVPVALGRRTLQAFPQARLVCLYGLTEAGSALSLKVFDPRTPDSIGRPLPGTQIRIVDQDRHALPAGSEGAIEIRQRGVFPLGYADAGAAAAEQTTFHDDGWVATGDIGYVDARGEVRLVGRTKELLFLEHGRRSPQAIEEHYETLIPAGVDYAVLGVPRPGDWDDIVLFLAGEVTDRVLTAVTAAVRSAPCAYPAQTVLSMDSIPRNPMGKVRRGALMDVYRAATCTS